MTPQDERAGTGAETPHLLLIDDDPTFGKIMGRIAEQSRIKLTFCRSLEELGESSWWRYHAAIVDFDLGRSTGLDVVRELERVSGGGIPVLLVSQSQQVDVPIASWPQCIQGFLQKALGHFAILEAALAACELQAVRNERKRMNGSSV